MKSKLILKTLKWSEGFVSFQFYNIIIILFVSRVSWTKYVSEFMEMPIEISLESLTITYNTIYRYLIMLYIFNLW